VTGRWPGGSGQTHVGEPVAADAGGWWPGGAAVQGRGWAKCKLTSAQLRELETVLDAGPAVSGWDEDQCWTLARIAGVIAARFGKGLHPGRGGSAAAPDRVECAGPGPPRRRAG